jgi:WD40 repeat protein
MAGTGGKRLSRRTVLLGTAVVAAAGVSIAVAKSGSSPLRDLAELTVGVNGVDAIGFSPDGAYLYAASNMQIQQWDTSNWQTGIQLNGDQVGLGALTVHPRGTLLAAVSDAVYVWDVWTGKLVQALDRMGSAADPLEYYTCLQFSPDGSLLAVGDEQGLIRLWNTTTWAVESELKGHNGSVGGLAFAPDGTTLVSGGASDNSVRVWKLSSRETIENAVQPGALRAASYSSDGRLYAVAYLDTVKFFDATTHATVATVAGFALSITAAAFVPGSHLVVAVDPNADVQLTNPAPGAKQQAWTTANGNDSVAVSPDGTMLAVGADGGGIHVWSIAAMLPEPPR